MASNKKRVVVPFKVKAQLLQEINSQCPFPNCGSIDVGHFEVHHIDSDPTNNDMGNLLMGCPTCHSKIEKGDITLEEVLEIKKNPQSRNNSVELYLTSVDYEKCSWKKYEVKNAFYLDEEDAKSPFPILQFHFINHFKKTIVLQSVSVFVKHLPSGLSGLPEPRKVPYSEVHRIVMSSAEEIHSIKNFQPVQIPSEQAYIFQVELLEESLPGEDGYFAPSNRQLLFFRFEFSNNFIIQPYKVLLNTDDEKRGVKIMLLS